jgi:hypothetical protein
VAAEALDGLPPQLVGGGFAVLGLDRVSESSRCRRQLAETACNSDHVRSGDGVIEVLDRCVESLPGFDWAASPGSRPKFVRGSGGLGARNRTPQEAGSIGFLTGVAFGLGGFREGA